MPWWATGTRFQLNGSVMGTKLGYGTSIVGCQLVDCQVTVEHKPVGLPLASIWLENSFWNTRRGMMLPPALVLTLQHTFPSGLGPVSAGIFTVVKASVLVLVLMLAIMIYLGSVPNHLWSCWRVTPSTLSLLSWGS